MKLWFLKLSVIIWQKRVIQNEIEDAMAEEYLDGKFVQGDTVALEMNENHIKFVRK